MIPPFTFLISGATLWGGGDYGGPRHFLPGLDISSMAEGLSVDALLAAFIVSAAVGITFGFYPAWKDLIAE